MSMTGLPHRSLRTKILFSDKKDNTSFCHPWASAPITVLIEELLGVSYDGKVGEHHIPAKAGRIKMKIPTRIGEVNIDIN